MRKESRQAVRAVFLAAIMVISVFAAGIAFSGSAAASDHVLVVDESGETGNYTSISGALTDADDGDRIEIQDGTYSNSEGLTVTTPNVTLTAASNTPPTVSVAPGSVSGTAAIDIQANGVTVSGLTVERAAAGNRGSTSGYAQGIAVRGSNVTIENNNIVGDLSATSNEFDRFSGIVVLDPSDGGTTENVDIVNNDVSGFDTGVLLTTFYGGSVSDLNISDTDATDNRVGFAAKVHNADGSISSVSGSGNDFTGSDEESIVFSPESYQGYSGLESIPTTAVNFDGPILVEDGDSIQTAVDVATAGATVELESGTYDEQVTVNKDLTITAEASTTLTRSNVPGSGYAGNSFLVVTNDARLELSGLEFEGPLPKPSTAGIYVTNDAHLTATDIQMNEMFVEGGDGNPSGAQSHDAIVVGRDKYDNGDGTGSLLLEDSVIDEFGKTAVTVKGETSNATIRNITIRGSGLLKSPTDDDGDSQPLGQDTILLLNGSQVVLEDSLIEDVQSQYGTGRLDAGAGVSFYGQAEAVIRDNTFQNVSDAVAVGAYGYQQYGFADNGPGEVIYKNNDVFDSQSGFTTYHFGPNFEQTDLVLRDSVIKQNEIENSLLFGLATTGGELDNVSVSDNTFSNVPVPVGQENELFAPDDLLENNEFDRAVVTRADGAVDNATIWGSIQDGVDAADPGDTVDVFPGTYEESVDIGTQSVTLEGPNAGTPGYGDRSAEAVVEGVTPTDGTTVTGLKFTGGGDGDAVDVPVGNVSDVVVENNVFEDLEEDRVAISAFIAQSQTENELRIEGNLIEGLSGSASGVYLQDPVDTEISDNVIDAESADEDTRGIQIDNGGNVVIDNNTIANTGANGIQIANDGDRGNNTVTNNTVINASLSDPEAGALTLGGSISGLTASGNDFIDSNAGVYIESGTSLENGVSITRNNIVGNDVGIQNNAEDIVAAELNWYGSDAGPNSEAGDNVTVGNVGYDPFLTTPIENIEVEDVGDTQQFAQDVIAPADQDVTAVGFPGPVPEGYTVGDAFENAGAGVIYEYSQEEGRFVQVFGSEDIDALDAFVIVRNTTTSAEDTQVVIEYAETQNPDAPGGPAVTTIDEGFNLISPRSLGDAYGAFDAPSDRETIYGTYGAPLPRSESAFLGPADQDTNFIHTTFGPNQDDPVVTPYGGYLVFTQEERQITTFVQRGTTADEVITNLNQTAA